jgi:hypothetical protein
MKKTIQLTTITLCTIAAIIWGSGCGKNDNTGGGGGTPQKSTEVSATKNSFNEVTSQLDAGGNLYAYLSTEEWLTGLSQKVDGWRSLADAIPDLKGDDKKNVGKVFDVVTDLIQKSGVEDMDGVGMSSIERTKGVYHSKVVLHHYKGKGTGFLWTMFGKTPHKLDGLDLLPATTAVAMYGDMDLGMVWSVLRDEINNAGIPEAKDAMQQLPDQFAAATGLQLDKVLASLGNEYGVVITLDDSKKISLPIGATPLEVPEPGVMIIVKVKDDTIFNRVDETLKDNQQVVRTDKAGVKMRTMPVPLPLPISLRPTIARSGDYMFIATTDTLVEEALAVKSGKKPGLKSTEEFKQLAKGMPEQGNSFSYASARFGKTWRNIQSQIIENNKADNKPQQTQFMQKLMDLNSGGKFAYSVSANTDEGWVATGNGSENPAKVALVPAIVVPALAAIAAPNFMKARETAQKNTCLSNLRQIDAAKQQWALKLGKTPSDLPTWADLKPYLRGAKGAQIKCPSGGTYSLHAVSDVPTCSHTGHQLPR